MRVSRNTVRRAVTRRSLLDTRHFDQGSAIKPLFTQGPSLTARLVTFVLASIILMTVDQRLHRLESLRAGLSAALYPLQHLVDLPTSGINWLSETLSSRTQLLHDNQTLRDERLQLQARMLRYEALQAENKRLKQLLDSSVKLEGRSLVAELLEVDPDPGKHQIVIDKGSRHSVFEGQPLLDATGIMGQILHVGPFSSTAILITDPDHALPVQVNRNGLRAIAVGRRESGNPRNRARRDRRGHQLVPLGQRQFLHVETHVRETPSGNRPFGPAPTTPPR